MKQACSEYRAQLVDSLDEHVDDHDPKLHAHVRECAECAAATEEVRAGWRMFNEPPAIVPSPALMTRVRASVLTLLDAEARGARRRRLLDAARVPLAVLSSLLVTAATLSLLGGLVWGSELPRGHLFFCAAIYTGLLVAAFSWIYGATSVEGVHLDAAARIGVIALAITIAGTTMCPEFHVLTWWDHSAAGRLLTGLLGPGGSSFVFGLGYGMLPGFLAALAEGRMVAEKRAANGLVAALVVFLLASPVMFLQTVPFTAGVIATWLAGTAVGTLCGVFGAQHVRRRVAASSTV